MSEQAKHTPTPWAIFRIHPHEGTRNGLIQIYRENGDGFDGEGSSADIAELYCATSGGVQEANAKLIIRAVNSHAALKAVAEMAMCPERDATDQYHSFHERLKAAAAAALEGIK